ncbi:AP-1 adaptor complex sigma subunit Aps1 [Rhodosporidiobolus nylandii]
MKEHTLALIPTPLSTPASLFLRLLRELTPPPPSPAPPSPASSPRPPAGKIVKDVTQLVLARRTRMCNFLEYKDSKVVYRRYASLFFVCGIGQQDNELITLEIIHRYVEVLDRYFGNVCELDLIFNYQKAYSILDELLIAGEMQESSKKSVLRAVGQADAIEEQEQSEDSLQNRLGRQ